MIKYAIKIKLLSETIFGNGQSDNGLVNNDVLIENDGFPYYLGKTFKGCLKQTINTIIKPSYSDKAKFEQEVNNLFGLPGSADGEGKLKFSNFYLDKSIKDLFINVNKLKENKAKDIISSTLTDIRFGIKMGETGVSEDGSLRASRVIKKDLIFNGQIYLDNELNDEQETILNFGIAAMKNLGVNKTRGKGNVKIEISKIKVNTKEALNIKDHNVTNKRYILYEFELLEPVKVGDSQSHDDYEESKSYISGSTLRGAAIKSYLKQYNDSNMIQLDEILRKVIFYDAYPLYTDGDKIEYSFPTPSIFRIDKDTDKKNLETYCKYHVNSSIENCSFFTSVFDEIRIDGEDKDKAQANVIKLKKGEFSWYDNEKKTLHQFNIKKDYNFHHSCIGKENIFRYKSISKGQKFYGIIDLGMVEDDKLKNTICNLFEQNTIFHLGGSRTSGYGMTQILSLETYQTSASLNSKLKFSDKSTIDNGNTNFYFLSDCILRDKYHQVISCLNSEYFCENMKVTISDDDIQMDINPTVTTGYNSKWKSYVPHLYGIEKGSVIEARFKSTKERKQVMNYMELQIGDRKQEGLGRVIVDPLFLQCQSIEIDNDIETGSVAVNQNKDLDNNKIIDKNFKDNIQKSIKEIIEQKYINQYIKGESNNFYKAIDEITASQLNNMILEIEKILVAKDLRKEINIYLDKLKEGTSSEIRNTKNSYILNENFRGYSFEQILRLEEQDIKNIDIIIKVNKELNKMFDNKVSQEYNHKLVLKIVKEELYYRSRMLYGKEGGNI